MGRAGLPTITGRGLGGELRARREATGLSGKEVAARLGWAGSKVSRMESGEQGVRVEDLAALLAVYGVVGAERRRLFDLAERAHQPGWWEVAAGLSDESRTMMRLEPEATAIVTWQPLLVPGLLQIEEYVRAVMRACGVPEGAARERVAARLARQAILTGERPPTLHAIVDETALRRAVGGRQVMARQLRQLAALAAQPRITLRVVPLRVGAHTGLDGSFTLLDFARDRSVVHLEHKLSGLFLEEPAQVSYFRSQADSLCRAALSPAASAELVARVATELERE